MQDSKRQKPPQLVLEWREVARLLDRILSDIDQTLLFRSKPSLAISTTFNYSRKQVVAIDDE